MSDTYYIRPEVSNSDLTSLLDKERLYDLAPVYRFGNLVDAMITDMGRVNHLTRQVDGEQFTQKEWSLAYDMLNAFRNDEYCRSIIEMSEGQKVFSHDAFPIHYHGMVFTLPMRCKTDLYVGRMQLINDIKSTACTSQRQFEESIGFFDYDRQGALYLDLSGTERFMFIGISKTKPHRIYKVALRRGDDMYLSGRSKYSELAFKWFTLFSSFTSSGSFHVEPGFSVKEEGGG